jgi:hypothetical protein
MNVRRRSRRVPYAGTFAILVAGGCNGLVQSSSSEGGTEFADATTSAGEASVSADSSAELDDAGEDGDAGCVDYQFPDGAPGCGGAGNFCCCGTCGGGLVCRGGMCAQCGSVGFMCCPGRVCQKDTVCTDGGEGTCLACGDPGTPCCGGNSCYNGGCCVKGTCVAATGSCGAAGGTCANGSCGIGTAGGACGGVGDAGVEPCCPDGECTAPNLMCNGATSCTVCGWAAQPCCPGGTCTIGNCHAGTCQ